MNFLIASSDVVMGKYGSWGVAVRLVFCLTLGFMMKERGI